MRESMEVTRRDCLERFVDVYAEVVTNCGLFVNFRLEGSEDRWVNMWLRHDM